MNKFVVFSCLHYTEQPPLMRTENYGDLVLGKLKGILEYARAKEAKVICLGDLFHRKAGTSIREINKMLDVMDGHEMYMICGNHDQQGYSPNLYTQPVGVLWKAGKIHLPDEDDVLDYCTDSVVITGKNYHVNYEALSTYNKKMKDYDFHIHCTHGMLTNSKLPYDATSVKDLEGNISADLILNGHNHKFFKDEELGIWNVGSVSRIAMDKNNITKKPVFLYIEYPSLKIEVVEIPIKKDVWIKEVKRDTLDNEEVEKFAKSIMEMELSNDEEILKELLKDEKEEIKEKIYAYLGE